MAVFWVQHYYTLPIVFEELGMGNELPHRRMPQLTDDTEDQQRGPPQLNLTHAQPMEFAPYPAQLPGQGQYENVQPLFNMGNMSNTLPDYQSRGYGRQPHQQQPSSSPSNNMVYQMQQRAQFAGQNAPIFNPTMQQQYVMPSQQPHQQGRATAMPYTQFGGLHQFSQPSHQQSQYPPQPQTQQFYQQPMSGTFGHSYAMGGGAMYPMGQMRLDGNLSTNMAFSAHQGLPRNLSRYSSESSLRVTIPRGPPRKPKQSGHALWVGNLPPGTHIIDLKDHFSRDATEQIESVFLISKSNCAFVNYKTEASCAAAMSRFHDSGFQGVRLVCRLRRVSTPPSANKSSGSSDLPGQESKQSSGQSGELVTPSTAQEGGETTMPGPEKAKEKYFIVKSLTIEDLEVSAQNGTWATQAHNEIALNKAYQSAENVYLIFSANKSGEYFGYARMASNIDDDSILASEHPQRPEMQQPSPAELPSTIPTPATATAPKGHIIDDSARCTIFWEAEVEETEGQKPEDPGIYSREGEDVSSFSPQAFGKPFRVEWLSTERLPFYKTRGLRNPWNSNREVKIARDGTELEPSVGRRLISMFSTRPSQQFQPGNSRSY